MQFLGLLIKPASSRCQLRCKYCFYADEAKNRSNPDLGIMTEAMQETIIQKTMTYFREPVTITYMFQGGEPTLAGLSWFQSFLNKVNQYHKPNHIIRYAIQTNGILLDDAWVDFLVQNHFLIGISIDGDMRTHNKYRLDISGNATYLKVLHALHLLQSKGAQVNVLTVLTSHLANHPDQYYRFLQKERITWTQLIPCLPSLEATNNTYALQPKAYADFFVRLFDLWYEEAQKGTIRSISLFDDIFALFQGKMPIQCGRLGTCQAQFVIEADGSVYPCDFYALDKWKCGSFAVNTFAEISANKARQLFVTRKRTLSPLCASCRYVSICHGGCQRQSTTFTAKDYCGHQKLLEHIESIIMR